jgi:hypothetical protein
MSRNDQSTHDAPIACLLDEREFAVRGEAIKQSLFAAVEQIDELPDGYAYRFPVDDPWPATVLEFIAAERRCCPFFTFEIVFTPHGGPLWLHLRGSAEIKAFIRDQFQVMMVDEAGVSA